MQPTFNHLGSEEFLIGCERCLDQNKNECLHHVIRVMAPVKAERVNKQTNKQPNTKEQTHLKPCWNNSSASNISAFEDWALKSCKEAWKDLFYQDIYRDNVQRAQALHLKQQDESIRRYTFTPIDRSRRMHSINIMCTGHQPL